MHSSIAAKHMNDRVLALNTLPGLLCIVLTQTHVGEILKVATHTKYIVSYLTWKTKTLCRLPHCVSI